MAAIMHRFRPVLILLAFALGGCGAGGLPNLTKAPEPPKLEPGVYPTRYKADIAALLRAELRNPVREAYVGDPVLRPISGVPHYITCVRYNLRRSNNEDAGNGLNYVIFLGGIVNQFLPGDPELCSGLNYQRYPDIETKAP